MTQPTDASTDLSTPPVDLRPGAVILAAGRGERMGRSKPLLPWGDRSLLEAWIARFQAAGIEQIAVILGAEYDAVRSDLSGLQGVIWTRNPDPEGSGPRESLLLGLEAIGSAAPAWFTPVDVPVVGATTIQRVLAAYRRAVEADPEGPGPLAALPSYRRTSGHPVLASPSFIAHLFDGERGDRIDAVLGWATRRQVIVEVDDVRVVGNMNRPQDYQAFVPPPGKTWDWTDLDSTADEALDGLATLDLSATNPALPVPRAPRSSETTQPTAEAPVATTDPETTTEMAQPEPPVPTDPSED